VTDLLERATDPELSAKEGVSPSGSDHRSAGAQSGYVGAKETVPALTERAVLSASTLSAQDGDGLGQLAVVPQGSDAETLETADHCSPETHGTSVGGEKRRRRGHSADASQRDLAAPSLADIHLALRHSARALLDLKKARVALQLQTKALTRAPEHGGIGMHELQAMATGLPTALDGMDAVETAFERHLVKMVKQHFMAEWIASVPGAGLPTFALLLGLTGPLDRFANPGKLWAYCGLAVGPNGMAPRRRKGVGMPVGEGNGLSFSPQARVICFQIGECFVKQRKSPYRALYDQKKAEYLARERVGSSECPFGQEHKDRNGKVVKCGLAHADTAARRYAVKRYLRDLWAEWHRRQPSKS
jgi:hypothetical protein